MPGALSAAEVAEIKLALQIPFDTFVLFRATIILTSLPFGRFKSAEDKSEIEIDAYKVEAKGPTGAVKDRKQGGVDLYEETMYIKPAVAMSAGLLDPVTLKLILEPGRDTLQYEGEVYQIQAAKNIGWFDGEYQLYLLGLEKNISKI